ncbi:MAG: family transporter protein [Gemmataceae bacterium]|nr:family transporter protein [Gemmataceae bacterium]
MTLILVRKLLRDVRPALVVVCLLLFAFAGLWVKITQRVTAEITPFFDIVAARASLNPRVFEEVIFRGPGKVSQAVLGGADLRFEQPNDFLAVGMLHPIVLVLGCVWAVGRAAGAVAGEIDRGTMELLLSQPVPRNRLILAHFLVDCVVIPTLCLSFYAGTQFGLWAVGPFTVDYTAVRKLGLPIPIPEVPRAMPVSGTPELPALSNLAALLFALSGITMALSANGRSRWKVIGVGVLVAVVMFIANVLGQLWNDVEVIRPFSIFYYYQPQKIMLREEWTTNLGAVWNGGRPLFDVPVVGFLLAVGAAGYLIALRVFTRRDLPAPL